MAARRRDRLDARVYRAPSPLHGDGCFARVPFAAGDYIGTFEGPSTLDNGAYVLWVFQEDGAGPIARIGRNLLRYLNHCEEGNAVFDGFDLHALRNIAAGEEITIDYGGGFDAPVPGPEQA